MIKTLNGVKLYLVMEIQRLQIRRDESKALMERNSIDGSILALRKLKDKVL
jgi:hypothetical protein